MEELSKKELQKIEGGSISTSTVLGVAGVFVFVIGLVDGYLRPFKCH